MLANQGGHKTMNVFFIGRTTKVLVQPPPPRPRWFIYFRPSFRSINKKFFLGSGGKTPPLISSLSGPTTKKKRIFLWVFPKSPVLIYTMALWTNYISIYVYRPLLTQFHSSIKKIKQISYLIEWMNEWIVYCHIC